MHAAYNGHAKCVKILLDHGANIEDRDEYKNSDTYGYTSLMFAAINEHVDCVKILIKYNAEWTCVLRWADNYKLSKYGEIVIEAVENKSKTKICSIM